MNEPPKVFRSTLAIVAGVLVLSLAEGFMPDRGDAVTARSSLAPRPAASCRGATDAHVAIRWPTAAQLREDGHLQWGVHLPRHIRRWAYLVGTDAAAAGIDPLLVVAVMRVESDGDPLIWNLDSDARGLLQVLHAPFEPTVNIRVGVSMLADLQRQFGGRDLVLAAYNAGPGSVREYGGIPPFTETKDYVIMVDYYRDSYAGMRLSRSRVARFVAARNDLAAFYRRICGHPWHKQGSGRGERM